MKLKDEKRFQLIGNVVMIIMTILAVAPLLLVIISSFTDNNTLIRNGYSYFPEEFSLDAYHYIFVENPQVLKAYLVSFRLTDEIVEAAYIAGESADGVGAYGHGDRGCAAGAGDLSFCAE